MITIQSGMLVALGFLAASLLGLLLASAFWSRAVRLTTERIKRSMPVSDTEIKADRDRLRAEYALQLHRLETQLDQTKLERARQIIEINRRDANIATLQADAVHLKTDLEENQNARRVLEQTVADRLPKVEARLAEAKRLLFNRDREIAELTHGAKRTKTALEEAASVQAQQSAQIDRLTTQLTTRGGRKAVAVATGEVKAESESALKTEVETLRGKTRDQAALIDRLLRRAGHGGYALAGPDSAKDADASAGAGDAEGVDTEADVDRLRQDLSQAEAALRSVREASAGGGAVGAAAEAEMRALRAKAEDQAGEIARLKAALAAFEQNESNPAGSSGLKDSKIALKVRLGSAQAQADQQQATISRLRAELASAHERLARQASHFMDEMRRIGTGPKTAGKGGPSSRPGGRRSLSERVAEVRPAQPDERPVALPAPSSAAATAVSPAVVEAAVEAEDAHTERLGNGNGNGHSAGNGSGNGSASAEATPAAEAAAEKPVAAELPKGQEIPEQRRRLRLLDRLTGTAKS